MSTVLTPAFNKFINDWDEAIEDWKSCCNTGKSLASSLLNCFTTVKYPRFPKDKELYFNEIPEPYYLKVNEDGSTDINCVVVDLNPGMSAQYEHLKYSLHKNVNKMTLANYLFGHNFPAHKYSEWQDAFHITNPSAAGINALKRDGWTLKDLPGYDWWRSERVMFISRLFKKIDFHKNNEVQSQISELPKLFAVELCPFHSKEWKKCRSITLNNCFKHQIEFATMALDICQNNKGLPFGLGFGKDVYDKMLQLGFVVVNIYDNKNMATQGLSEYWPKDKNRSFAILKWPKAPSKRFLVTYYSGGFKAPAEWFDDVILKILDMNNMI